MGRETDADTDDTLIGKLLQPIAPRQTKAMQGNRTQPELKRCSTVCCQRTPTHYRQCRRHLLTGAVEFAVSVVSGLILTIALLGLSIVVLRGAFDTLVSESLVVGLVGLVPAVLFCGFTLFTFLTTVLMWPAETRFWRLYRAD